MKIFLFLLTIIICTKKINNILYISIICIVAYGLISDFYVGKHIYNQDLTIYINYGDGYIEQKIKQGTQFADILDKSSYLNKYLYGINEPLYDGEYIDLTIGCENRLSINSATKEQLIELPGIGEKTANKIIEYRELKGGFYYLEELKNVKGIGDGKYEKLKQYICL